MNKKYPDYLCVALLGSGYAAIHMRYYDDMEGYDIQQTGLGRYKTKEEAIVEAKDWAVSDEIEFQEPKL